LRLWLVRQADSFKRLLVAVNNRSQVIWLHASCTYFSTRW
jgi:hypothetical protein